MVEEVIAREGFGDDPVPDLLFVNFKAIDHVSHIWSANSPEMQDTPAWQDEDLGGSSSSWTGRSVKAATCSCSPPTTAQFDPAASRTGAFQVTPTELERDLERGLPGRRRYPCSRPRGPARST